MAGLENLWSRFTLDEEEEYGAEVPKSMEETVHRLAGRFFTKRTLNVESVARTFKPLWKPTGELKLRDLGDNILLFEFSDALDLAQVLEFEPWTFDKNIVVFREVTEVEEVPSLEFFRVNFWIQMHNLPLTSLNQATGEAIGNSIGKVIDVANPEDDGEGGEFLRVRISIDITKPLSRCHKLWSEGKQIGWVGLKSKGGLKKDEQQFGDWMRAEMIRSSRKSVVVISGRARSQVPWWRKPSSKEKTSATNSMHGSEAGLENETVVGDVVSSFQEVTMEDAVPFKPVQEEEEFSKSGRAVNSISNNGSSDCLTKSIQGLCVAKQDARDPSLGHTTPPTFNGLVDFNSSHAEEPHVKDPLGDSTNQLSPLSQSTSLKTFKKIARNIVPRKEGVSNESVLEKRSVMISAEVQGVKRQQVLAEGKESKENIQVETGFQSHPVQ
nr:hypothetical protein CFP56_25176 [Quercus suber]